MINREYSTAEVIRLREHLLKVGQQYAKAFPDVPSVGRIEIAGSDAKRTAGCERQTRRLLGPLRRDRAVERIIKIIPARQLHLDKSLGRARHR